MIAAEEFVKALNLTVLSPSARKGIQLSSAELNRPGMQFAGYYEHFAYERPQVIGKVEMSYLDELEDSVRLERLKKAFEGKTVVTQENMKCIVRLCSQCFQLPDDIMLSVIGGQDYINRCIHRGCRFPQALLSEGRFPVPDVYSCRTVC